VLVTSAVLDGVSLTPVLGHGGVDGVDDISPDRGSEHAREGEGAGAAAVLSEHRDLLEGGHGERWR
jgi:hypothetical protein